MNKKNKYGKAILVTGFIAIVVVTICAFQKDKIVYKYYEYTIDKKYSKININDYYKDDNFNYSVWYKNGLHNVYVYYKNSTYEYEYFDYENKIILKEVENKKYKR